uniref:Aftiphilin n=1 Tax=Acrobeloides nanus TaxID=290746 RepID=A0A914DIJ5_9BILA
MISDEFNHENEEENHEAAASITNDEVNADLKIDKDSEVQEENHEIAASITHDEVDADKIDQGSGDQEDVEEMSGQDDGEDGFDDDDFGDFEEATIAEPSSSSVPEKEEPQPAAFADFRRFSSQSSFDSSLASFCDILENSSLWLFDHSFDEIQLEFCDIIALLDAGNAPADIELLEPFQKALWLWSQICYIEETAALKFSWHNSLSYTKLLGSLSMSQEKAYAKSKDLPIFAQHLIGSQKILKPMSAAEAASPTTPNVTIVKSSSQEIDSLSVAPVNFDWQSSGLSNPLTSAALTTNFVAINETDFLASLEAQTSSRVNGSISVLEQDLHALGLVEDKKPSTSFNGPSNTAASAFASDITSDLVLKNSNSSDEIGTNVKRKTKPISELSQGAQELLLELPDYSYMLANVLMFPVVNR